MNKCLYYLGLWFFIWGLFFLIALSILLYKSIIPGWIFYILISGIFYCLVRKSILIFISAIGFFLSNYYFFQPKSITEILIVSCILLFFLIFIYIINIKKFLVFNEKFSRSE